MAPARGPAGRRRGEHAARCRRAGPLWKAMSILPRRQRTALVLRYYEDLSERDAAEALGCSLSAMKSLVARGSEALRDVLTTHTPEGDDRCTTLSTICERCSNSAHRTSTSPASRRRTCCVAAAVVRSGPSWRVWWHA